MKFLSFFQEELMGAVFSTALIFQMREVKVFPLEDSLSIFPLFSGSEYCCEVSLARFFTLKLDLFV